MSSNLLDFSPIAGPGLIAWGWNPNMPNHDVTLLLESIEQGDPDASDQFLSLVYEELRRLAAYQMAREVPDHTLQPTALVHEAYLRLIGRDARWNSRSHFFAAAAEAMRRILIESARRKSSQKRGGGRTRLEFSEEMAPQTPPAADSLLALDEALRKLERADAESAQVVTLRFFGGLTVEEVAETMGISARTVKRYWSFARAWLQREIDRD